MKQSYGKKLLAIAAAVMFIGIVVIMASQSLGLKQGERAIHKNGGYMETSQYNRITEESAANYRVIGIILAAIGGYGLVTFGNTLYNNHE